MERVQSPAVAKILGLTTRAVQEMAVRGEIPSAARIGRRWTFNEKIVRQWLARKEEEVCRKTYTDAAEHGGAVSRLPARITDEAYERAIGLRPKSA